jgi:membrane protease YdiL (CAAX protease family)
VSHEEAPLTTHNEAPIIPAEQIPATRPSTLRNIFIGADGLRAGWSLLIFITLFAAMMFAMNIIGHKLHPSSHKGPSAAGSFSLTSNYINEAIPLAVLLLLTWIMSKIERRPSSVYGLGGTRKLPHFLAGLAWGVTCLSLLILALWKTGLLVIDSRLLFGAAVFRYGALWLIGFLLVALLEEYLTRGYLQYTLARGLASIYKSIFNTRHDAALGFWTAALIFSILFGLGHGANPGESPIGLLSVVLSSMVFCLSLWRTGSLWWAIGFHSSWDWAQSFVYGVADSGTMVQHHLLASHPVGRPILSGGATGPEGSLFILAIVTLIALIILFTLPRTRYNRTHTLARQPHPLEA